MATHHISKWLESRRTLSKSAKNMPSLLDLKAVLRNRDLRDSRSRQMPPQLSRAEKWLRGDEVLVKPANVDAAPRLSDCGYSRTPVEPSRKGSGPRWGMWVTSDGLDRDYRGPSDTQ
jgi:hypothetical protein